LRTAWSMPRSGAILVEARVCERLLRPQMCVQRPNSRCAHNSIAPPSWTRIDYGICPIGTTAVTVRDSRRMARHRVICTFPVRNSCLSELPRPAHHSPHGQDGHRSQMRGRYNPHIAVSPVCTGTAVNRRVSALDAGPGGGLRFGYARMMHYGREMARRRVIPARCAGDPGFTEACSRPEMSHYASPLRRLNQPNGRARTRIGLRQRRSLTLVRMRRTRTCCGLPSGIQGVKVPRLLHPEIMRPQRILRDQ